MLLILIALALNQADGVAQNFKVGQTAPDIILKNPDGREIKLSDLNGKVVLIDFWASWCVPCRRENPYLKEAYRKFKETEFKEGDGFTIYSISLDTRTERWVQAIEKDGLKWPYHGCDMKGWRSKVAKKYGVKAIPANFLVNGKGIIVAVDLRGSEIKETLNKMKIKWYNEVFDKSEN